MYLSTKSQQLLQCILVICIVQSGMAIPHQFFFDNEDLFSPCEDVPPGAGGIHDLFDLTNFTMAYDEGNMYISGSITCVWKDLVPDDHIEALSHAEKEYDHIKHVSRAKYYFWSSTNL
ncbi:uncharacterized protein LOC142239495 [Haematobia irritans]|uniref:uncharacterized protein LOC142239495 n=1 Tax=Haematobia irritans TaxID=7368 RepID=UPI003F5070B2